MKFGLHVCVYRLSLNCMNYIAIIFFTHLAGGGMAAIPIVAQYRA